MGAITRGKPLFLQHEWALLRVVRTQVDGGLRSEYLFGPVPTYQRPGYYTQPGWVWAEGEDEPRLEWV